SCISFVFFFSSRRRHTISKRDWSSDVCSSDLVIFGAVLNALSLNFFLINANVYASGFTGASQLLASIFNDFLGIGMTTGIILLILNIPVVILGWLKVGKGFTIYSIFSVIFMLLFLELFPFI